MREAAIVNGVPVSNRTGGLRFEDAARDLVNDYTVNHRRSLDELERRITKHLAPYFGSRRMTTITTADVRAYIVQRQQSTEILRAAHTITRKDGMTRQVPEQRRIVAGVSNAEINRELTALKRMFTLAVQAGKLLHRPHVPLLQEDNVRTGFFEVEQFASVRNHLPPELRPMITFTTGQSPVMRLTRATRALPF